MSTPRTRRWHPVLVKGFRVLLVEDDAFTRSTLAAALTAGGVEIVAAVANAADALQAARGGVEAAVIDLDLGRGPTGVDLAVALRSSDPSIGLVMLTSYDDPRLFDPSLPNLPNGTVYLRKRQVTSVQDVDAALRQAVCRPSSPEATSQRLDHGLTNAQIELLRDVSRGLTNAQLAQANGVSVSAVEKSLRKLALAVGVADGEGNTRALLVQAYNRMSGNAG